MDDTDGDDDDFQIPASVFVSKMSELLLDSYPPWSETELMALYNHLDVSMDGSVTKSEIEAGLMEAISLSQIGTIRQSHLRQSTRQRSQIRQTRLSISSQNSSLDQVQSPEQHGDAAGVN